MRSKRSGFTLIELMLVIAIVAILAALTIPAFLRLTDKNQAFSVIGYQFEDGQGYLVLGILKFKEEDSYVAKLKPGAVEVEVRGDGAGYTTVSVLKVYGQPRRATVLVPNGTDFRIWWDYIDNLRERANREAELEAMKKEKQKKEESVPEVPRASRVLPPNQ